MVDFALNDEQKMMADMARDFARTEIRPLADKYYRKGEKIPHAELDELLKKANGLRLIDYYFPAEYGGLGVTGDARRQLTSHALGDLGDLIRVRRDLLGHLDDPRARFVVAIRHERRIGHRVLVCQLHELHHERLRTHHRVLILGKPRSELCERRGKRTRQRSRSAAGRRRRALTERSQELTDL